MNVDASIDDRYSCVPPWRLGQGAADPFAPTTQHTQTQHVTRANHSWDVTLGGHADMDSTLTPSASCKKIAFQVIHPEDSLTVFRPFLLSHLAVC